MKPWKVLIDGNYFSIWQGMTLIAHHLTEQQAYKITEAHNSALN